MANPNDHYVGDWYTGDPEPQKVCPIASDHEPTFTGVLDANGQKIYRQPEPIGFHTPGGRRVDYFRY